MKHQHDRKRCQGCGQHKALYDVPANYFRPMRYKRRFRKDNRLTFFGRRQKVGRAVAFRTDHDVCARCYRALITQLWVGHARKAGLAAVQAVRDSLWEREAA